MRRRRRKARSKSSLSLPSWGGLLHIPTSAVRCYSRGLARSLSGSSLRTQGPITPGLKSEERPLLPCRNESPRRMGPCVRRDDSLKRHAYGKSICDSPALVGEGAISARRDVCYSAAIISFACARWRVPQSRIAAITGTKLLPLRVSRYSTLGGTTP